MCEEALERRRADHIARDVFHASTIEYPLDCEAIYYKGDWVAFISKSKTQNFIYRLALWSLVNRCKVWGMELDRAPAKIDTSEGKVSSTGMVLITPDFHSGLPGRVIKDGVIIGRIEPGWTWVALEGNDVLTHYVQSGITYYAEWNHSAEKVVKYAAFKLFNHSRNAISNIVFNDHYWVKLSISRQFSTVEVVNRVEKSFQTFKLAIKLEDTWVTKPCIQKDQLFFTKPGTTCALVICILDLSKGVVRELGTNSRIFPYILKANAQYVVWCDTQESVQYLNLQTHIISEINIKISSKGSIHLNSSSPILTVLYVDLNTATRSLHREVFDLADGRRIQDVHHDLMSGSYHSFESGYLLITGPQDGETVSKLYIESFNSEGSIRSSEPRQEDFLHGLLDEFMPV